MKYKVLRFFEYDKVSFSKAYLDITGQIFDFTTAQISALQKYHTASQGVYYDLIDKGIRFKEHVGVIQINDLTIEVLPKIDNVTAGKKEEELQNWHDILLGMLKECQFINPQTTGYAHLKLKSNSILTLYFEKFVAELDALLHKGLIKKYRALEDNQPVLKGRLLFAQHLQKNLSHAERFYTSHTVYDNAHKVHQILFQALEAIHYLTKNQNLSGRIKAILVQWPKGKHLQINEALFEAMPVTRKTQPYQEALLIARMILLNYHPDLRGGNQSLLALMFDMNELWEEFIFRRLKASERSFNWKVSAQKGMKYWTSESGSKKLIPDIIIEFVDTRKKIIIDTKWKRPHKNKPDDHDLRQLLSYKLYYEGDRAYLLYPCCDVQSKVIEGDYLNNTHQNNGTVFKEGLQLQGGLLFFNVVDKNKLITPSEFLKYVSQHLS